MSEEGAVKTFEFTIIATGLDPQSADFEDRLYEAGCDDATVSVQKGLIVLDFAREAKNFTHALTSAIANVRQAGARVERVEPDDLVSISDIAKRSGLTRSAISLYANHERGSNFPTPVARLMTESPLWAWLEVSRWMLQMQRIALETVVHARLIQDVNYTSSDKPSRRMPTAAHIDRERECA
jgi:hypothetical protein